MTGAICRPQEVLEFWFGPRARPLWFEKDAAFDAEIRAGFAATLRAADEGALRSWEAAPESSLALVIVLDQFPRNIHRGSPKAFASDALARAVADRAIDRGFDQALPPDRRWFLYLPFEHSEDLSDQRRGVALFRAHAEGQSGAVREQAFELVRYAERHMEIIERFGRFPHRNAVLGRDTSPAEAAFLSEPHSSF